MKQEVTKSVLVLTNEEMMNTSGGYTPPEGGGDDLLNPEPSYPKPFDPICW